MAHRLSFKKKPSFQQKNKLSRIGYFDDLIPFSLLNCNSVCSEKHTIPSGSLHRLLINTFVRFFVRVASRNYPESSLTCSLALILISFGVNSCSLSLHYTFFIFLQPSHLVLWANPDCRASHGLNNPQALVATLTPITHSHFFSVTREPRELILMLLVPCFSPVPILVTGVTESPDFGGW